MFTCLVGTAEEINNGAERQIDTRLDPAAEEEWKRIRCRHKTLCPTVISKEWGSHGRKRECRGGMRAYGASSTWQLRGGVVSCNLTRQAASCSGDRDESVGGSAGRSVEFHMSFTCSDQSESRA